MPSHRYVTLTALVISFFMVNILPSVADDASASDYLLKLNSEAPASQSFWLDFSHDGRLLASVGLDKTVRLWDVPESLALGKLSLLKSIRPFDGRGTNGLLFSARFSPDDEVLAVGTNRGCYFFDIHSGRSIAYVSFPINGAGFEPFHTIAFSPDGKWMASGHIKSLRFWKLGSLLDRDARDSLSSKARSQELIDNAIRVDAHEDAATGYSFYSLDFEQTATGQYRLLSTSDNNCPEIWKNDGNRWRIQNTLNCKSPTLMARFLKSPDRIMTFSEDQAVFGWDLKEKSTFFGDLGKSQQYRTPRVAPLRDGKHIAIGNWPDSSQCAVMDSTSGEIKTRFLSHDNQVTAIAASPTENLVATSGSTATRICLWNPDTGRLIASTRSSGVVPRSCAFSADGREIAYGTKFIPSTSLRGLELKRFESSWDLDRFQFMWGLFRTNAVTRPLEHVFNVATIQPESIADSKVDAFNDEVWHRNQLERDGWEIDRYTDFNDANKDWNELVVVRSGIEAKRIASLNGNRIDAASLVALDQSGRMGAIVAAGDSTRLYDLETEAVLADFIGQTGFTESVAVSPDQNLLLHAGGDQVLRLYSLKNFNQTPRKLGINLRPGSNIIDFIQPHGAGQIAGLNVGDALIKAADQQIDLPEDLDPVLEGFAPGAKLRLEVKRDGRTVTVTVVPRMIISPLLSIHVTQDGRWVAWTEQGFYACSPGSDDLFGWQVNGPDDQVAQFYSAKSFQAALYRPKLVREYVASHGDPAVLPASLSIDQLLASSVPPEVTVNAPSHGELISKPSIELVASIRHSPALPIQAVNISVNGRVSRAVGLRPKLENDLYRENVTLFKGENVIAVQAVGPGGILSDVKTVRVTCNSKEAPEFDGDQDSESQPELYVVGVGVSHHADSHLNLAYASKDARDIVSTFQKQNGMGFQKVHVQLLEDDQATRQNVLDALKSLRDYHLRPQDYVVVFLAGHGVQDDNGDYCFVTTDARLDALSQTTVAWSEFHSVLQRVESKSFLIIDTCHAGAIAERPDLREQAQESYNEVLRQASMDLSGVITIASCLPHELSYEDPAWENGAFTESLIEAIEGQADLNDNGDVTISELETFVSTRVEELSHGRQSSCLFKSISVPSNLKIAKRVP